MLWDSIAEDVVIASAKRARAGAREDMASAAELAVDLLGDRQCEKLVSELHTRWPTSMNTAGVDAGQRIYPVPVPLFQRFVEEQATLYSRPVHRYYVDDSGAETDATRKLSADMRNHLADSGYNEAMEQVETLAVALHPAPAGLWYQIVRNELVPSLVMPQCVYPIHPNGGMIDEADQQAYDGHIVELGGKSDNPFSDTKGRCAYITGAETWIYEGEPDNVRRVESTHKHMAMWEQVDADGKSSLRPLNPLTLWHWKRPVGQLLPPPGQDLATATIEVSLAVTMIFDHERMQGFSAPWMTVSDPSSAQYTRKYGSRFPWVGLAGEAFGFATSGVNFQDLLTLPLGYIRLVAVLKRMSSNDFAIDGSAAQSGFAKLVDSLPKLEARERLKERWARLEQRMAGPQITANLIAIGVLPEAARKLKMRVKFADVSFPEDPSERNERLSFDLEHGLTTPARILAEREGISEEEAQKRIDESREKMAAKAPVDADLGDAEAGTTGMAPGAAPKDPGEALNGAQVTALKELLSDVAAGLLPRESAIALMLSAFPISQQQAEAIMGTVGNGFVQQGRAAETPGPQDADDGDDPLARIIGRPGAKKPQPKPPTRPMAKPK